MYSGTPLFKWELPQPQAEITSKLEAGGGGLVSLPLSRKSTPSGCCLVARMSNNVCGGRVGSMGKKICISSSCHIMARRGAPAREFLCAQNSTKGQLFIGVPKLILLLLVSTDTWQTTKCVRVQRLREGLQNGGHCDPLVR